MSEAGAPSLTLAKYRQQGSLANAILKSTPLSGKAHEIFDDEPSASEGVPARGSKTTKPGVSSTGQSLLKGNRDVRCIHFLVRKFSTGKLRLERRHCSQCCDGRRRHRLAGAFGPRHHYRRCSGDCFPQALLMRPIFSLHQAHKFSCAYWTSSGRKHACTRHVSRWHRSINARARSRLSSCVPAA